MKNLRKTLSLIMVMVMAMSVVACGSKSGSSKKLESLSTDELVAKMSEKNADIKGVKGNGTLELAATISGMEVKVDAKYDISSVAEPVQSAVKMDMTANMLGMEQSMSYEIYETVNGDSAEVYTGMDGEWTYQEVELGDYSQYTAQMTDMLTNVNISDYADYFDKLETTVKGKNYVMTLEASTTTLLSKLSEVEALSEYLGQIDASIIPDAKITLELVVNGTTLLPVSTTINVGLDSYEYEGTTIEVSKCKMVINYDSFENVEITIPEEALAAK